MLGIQRILKNFRNLEESREFKGILNNILNKRVLRNLSAVWFGIFRRVCIRNGGVHSISRVVLSEGDFFVENISFFENLFWNVDVSGSKRRAKAKNRMWRSSWGERNVSAFIMRTVSRHIWRIIVHNRSATHA